MTTILAVDADVFVDYGGRTWNASAALRDAVQRLDQHAPYNWRTMIDRERFDITTLHDCVLGQLYGSYMHGMEVLFTQAEMTNRMEPIGMFAFSAHMPQWMWIKELTR